MTTCAAPGCWSRRRPCHILHSEKTSPDLPHHRGQSVDVPSSGNSVGTTSNKLCRCKVAETGCRTLEISLLGSRKRSNRNFQSWQLDQLQQRQRLHLLFSAPCCQFPLFCVASHAEQGSVHRRTACHKDCICSSFDQSVQSDA